MELAKHFNDGSDMADENQGCDMSLILEDVRQHLSTPQQKFDAIIRGTAPRVVAVQPEKTDRRPFASFLPNDQKRALALANLCIDIFDEQDDTSLGAVLALDELLSWVGKLPEGMVQRSASLFYTHCIEVQEILKLPTDGSIHPAVRLVPFPAQFNY